MLRWIFCLTFTLLSVEAFAETQFVKLTSDKASYSLGEPVQIRIQALVRPTAPDLEFFLKGSVDAAPIPIAKLTEIEFYSVLKNLGAGLHTFSIEVFTQDRQLASELTAALSFYDSESLRISTLISLESNPQKRAALLSQLSQNDSKRAEAVSALNKIRRKTAGPESIQFQIN